ncbi:MAG: rod shape-determining protein MreC [Acutalibacteraceae bacterium]
MKGRLGSRSFKVLIAVVCVFLVIILVTSGNKSIGSFLTNYVIIPLQKSAAGMTESVKDSLPSTKTVAELEEENSRLAEENRQYREMLVEYYDLKEQNELLLEFYDIKEEHNDYKLVAAKVIARNPNENFYEFTIDRGKTSDITVGCPVVTPDGLIGQVCAVSETSCTVQTILSPNIQISVWSKKTKDGGIISGTPVNADLGLTVMKNVSAQNKMTVGDIIVTTGTGGVYPSDLIVGAVSEITYDKYDSTPIAIIKPYEDIQNLTTVAVITDFDGKNTVSYTEDTSSTSTEVSS